MWLFSYFLYFLKMVILELRYSGIVLTNSCISGCDIRTRGQYIRSYTGEDFNSLIVAASLPQ